MMKSPKVTTPRQSRPLASTTPITSSLRSLSKPGISPSLPKSKNLTKGEKKNAVPKALNMSIALGSTNSHLSSPATRKSFIMERMGDKDIVKRAFKMFQNNYVGQKLSGEESEQVSLMITLNSLISNIRLLCWNLELMIIIVQNPVVCDIQSTSVLTLAGAIQGGRTKGFHSPN